MHPTAQAIAPHDALLKFRSNWSGGEGEVASRFMMEAKIEATTPSRALSLRIGSGRRSSSVNTGKES